VLGNRVSVRVSIRARVRVSIRALEDLVSQVRCSPHTYAVYGKQRRVTQC